MSKFVQFLVALAAIAYLAINVISPFFSSAVEGYEIAECVDNIYKENGKPKNDFTDNIYNNMCAQTLGY